MQSGIHSRVLQSGAFGVPSVVNSQLPVTTVPPPVQNLESPEIEENQNPNAKQRILYLRKFYLALFFHLLYVTVIVRKALNLDSYSSWLLDHYGFSFITSLIVCLAILVGLFLMRNTLTKTPINYVVYAVFTIMAAFFFSYLEARIKSTEDGFWYYLFLSFTVITAGLVVHSFLSQYLLTFQSATLYIIGTTALCVLLYLIFTEIDFHVAYAVGIIALIWAFFLVWENESVISGARGDWSREDAFVGAVASYLGIFTITITLSDLIRKFLVKER